MQAPQGQTATPSQPLTIAQLIFSGLGMVLSFLAALGLGIFGLIGLLSESSARENLVMLFSMAWIALLVAVLAIPSVISSARRLWPHVPALPRVGGLRTATLALFLWPLVLLLGALVSRQQQVAWLLLPPLQLLAIGLPVWWLTEVARNRLKPVSPQRAWGLVNFSILLTTPLLMVVEILVMLFLGLVFAAWASTQPALLDALNQIMNRLMAARGDPEAILPLLAPYLQKPLVIYTGLAVIAGLTPLIEELLKPLAVWFLIGRDPTPAEGFAAGALCGAGFALIESLFYLSNPAGGSWAWLAVGRGGTELLHITTTALVGWAMASAWRDSQYVRLGAVYLLAAGLHGLWNAMGVLSGLAIIVTSAPTADRSLVLLAEAAPFALAFLAAGLFLILWRMNQHLQAHSLQVQPTPATAPAAGEVPPAEAFTNSNPKNE